MGEHNQQFDTFQQWVGKASSWLTRRDKYDPRGSRVICYDTAGRLCRIGGDFMRARDEGTFPVRWVWPDEVASMMAKIDKAHAELAAKLKEHAE